MKHKMLALWSHDAEDVLWHTKSFLNWKEMPNYLGATGQRDRESEGYCQAGGEGSESSPLGISLRRQSTTIGVSLSILGRIRSGELSVEFYDKLDADIAEICIANPGTSTRRVIIELNEAAATNPSKSIQFAHAKAVGPNKATESQIVTNFPVSLSLGDT